MAQIYKALVEFELEGKKVGIGEEVVLRAREGEELVKQGTVASVDRELDPETEKDAALLAQCDERAETKHDEMTTAEETREEMSSEREVENDKVEEAAKADEAAKVEEEKATEEAATEKDAAPVAETPATPTPKGRRG